MAIFFLLLLTVWAIALMSDGMKPAKSDVSLGEVLTLLQSDLNGPKTIFQKEAGWKKYANKNIAWTALVEEVYNESPICVKAIAVRDLEMAPGVVLHLVIGDADTASSSAILKQFSKRSCIGCSGLLSSDYPTLQYAAYERYFVVNVLEAAVDHPN